MVAETLSNGESDSRNLENSRSFLGFNAGDWGAVGLLVLAVAGVLVEWKLLFHDKGDDAQFLLMVGSVLVYALFIGSIVFTVNAFREYKADKNGEITEVPEDSRIHETSDNFENSDNFEKSSERFFNYSDFIDIASLRSMDNNAQRKSFVIDMNMYETSGRRDAQSIIDALIAKSELKNKIE